jgi:hypothetical protein
MKSKDTLLSAKWVRKKKKAKAKAKAKTKTQPKLTLLLQLPITFRCLANPDKRDLPDQKTHS